MDVSTGRTLCSIIINYTCCYSINNVWYSNFATILQNDFDIYDIRKINLVQSKIGQIENRERKLHKQDNIEFGSGSASF